MRWLSAIALVVVALPAHADEATVDADGDPLPRRVRVRLAGQVARFDVQLPLDVEGPASEESNLFHLPLPDHGVITGATIREGRRAHRLGLERVDLVDTLFGAIVDRPGRGSHRTWAVRIDVPSIEARIGIAAPRDARIALDLAVEAPTCLFADARFVQIPATWRARLVPPREAPAAPDEIDEACGTQASGEWISLPTRELAARPAGEQRISTRTGRLATPAGHIARVELGLAGALAEIPRDLHTAILVDHSRSLTADELESERAIVAAYLRAAPDGRVQVIGYARHAHALLPSWMPAAAAATRVDRALRNLAPRNGSNIDEALAAASTWLSRVTGTRRIIVLTDERLAERLAHEPASLRSHVPDGTVVHAVAVTMGGKLGRADDVVLAPLALESGGMAMRGGVDESGEIDVLALARPTSLDKITITGRGWRVSTLDNRGCPDELGSLREGTSCVWWADGNAASGVVTVEGWLWGHRVTRVIEPDLRQARAVARMLSTQHELAPELKPHVDRAARAVNSVWSLFAMWGKQGGYEGLETFGTIGFGTSGCCSSSHSHGVTGMGRFGRIPNRGLHAQLAPVVARCAARTRLTVSIETTREEIVDVDVSADEPDERVETCVREGIWDTALSIPDPPSHARGRLEFQPT